jgi:hypothetical protein
MIAKLDMCYIDESIVGYKINELVDAVNEMQATISKMENVAENGNFAKNAQPDYVTTSYMTDGNTREYYGQNGASIITDQPLPAGYVITIKETKGGDNE